MVMLKKRLIIFFLSALFSDRCWRLVGINRDLSIPLLDKLQLSKASFGTPAIFVEIVIVVAWCIQFVRNGIIFDGASLSLWRWKRILRDLGSLFSGGRA
jgi:hypothetical protein